MLVNSISYLEQYHKPNILMLRVKKILEQNFLSS